MCFSHPYSCRCLNKKHFPKKCSKAAEAKAENNTDERPPFFVTEGRERRMEADRGRRDSLTAGIVWGNLRNGRWDRLSKQGGFSPTGDSHALSTPSIYALAPFSPPALQLYRAFLLSDGLNNGRAERKRRLGGEQTKRRKNLSFVWRKGNGKKSSRAEEKFKQLQKYQALKP